MGEVMDGAMQQAPQPTLHSMRCIIVRAFREGGRLIQPSSIPSTAVAKANGGSQPLGRWLRSAQHAPQRVVLEDELVEQRRRDVAYHQRQE